MTQAQTTTSRTPHVPHRASRAAVMIARVSWLVKLRWALVVCLAAAGGVSWFALESQDAAWRTWPLAALVAAYNLATWSALRWLGGRPLAGAEEHTIARLTNAQIAMDLIVLTAAMYMTGGAANPLVVVMVFLLAISASLLPARDAYRQVILAAVLYTGLTVAEPMLAATVGQPGSIREWPLGIRIFRASTVVAVMFLVVYFTNAILARLRRINNRLTDANRQLAALDLTKSRFLRISSHQLRGPLVAIYSLLSAIREAGGLTDTQSQLMRKIQAREQDVMKQLDEMMLLSTVKESAVETTRTGPVELRKVLDEALGAYSDEVRQKDIELTVDAENGIWVSAWQDALEIVFEHLISNAVKYTRPGGSVAIKVRKSPATAEIEISDTGIGISPDQQERVFREFYRGTNAQQIAGGTGLGLSIVKAIVERLAGQIALESAPGEGTTVSFSLPLSDASRNAPDAQPEKTAPR